MLYFFNKVNKFVRLIMSFYLVLSSGAIMGEPTTTSGITYSLSGGRFGDNLIAYCHARWVAYSYDIPFYYTPFPHSDQLAMHHIHKQTSSIKFQNTHIFPQFAPKSDSLVMNKHNNTLYVIPYFPECPSDIAAKNFWHFDIGWDNKEFVQLLQREIVPIRPVNLIPMPKNVLTIAVHVRSGSGKDNIVSALKSKRHKKYKKYKKKKALKRFTDQRFPLKFPPHDFYIQQLKRISQLYPDRELYAFIFTDNINPELIAQQYKSELKDCKITFGYRPAGTNHEQNLLEDFFSLLSFDCLIRPESNYSIMAARLGHYKIVMSPKKCTWVGDSCVVDAVDIKIAT